MKVTTQIWLSICRFGNKTRFLPQKNMKVLVLGASPNPTRFSHKAVSLLKKYGHEPIPIGIRTGKIKEIEIIKGKPQLYDIHTITLYLRPERQKQYYDYILSLSPKRVIFNPGTENPELKQLLELQGIETVEQCTLVMLHSELF